MSARAILAALGAAALAVFLFAVDPGAAWRTISAARGAGVAVALAAVAVGVLLKALRWQWLIETAAGVRVPYRSAVLQILAGVAAGSLVPSRAVEPAKPVMVRAQSGVPLAPATAAVVFERVLDGSAVLLLFWIFLLRAPVFPVARATVGALSAAGVLAVALLLAFPLAFGRIASAVAGRLSPRLGLGAKRLFATFATFRGGRDVWLSVAASLVAAALDVARAAAVMRAAGLQAPLGVVGLSVTGASLFAVATFVPGGVGVAELSQTALLLLGIAASPAAAGGAVLLDRIVGYYLVIVVGAGILIFARPQESVAAPPNR